MNVVSQSVSQGSVDDLKFFSLQPTPLAHLNPVRWLRKFDSGLGLLFFEFGLGMLIRCNVMVSELKWWRWLSITPSSNWSSSDGSCGHVIHSQHLLVACYRAPADLMFLWRAPSSVSHTDHQAGFLMKLSYLWPTMNWLHHHFIPKAPTHSIEIGTQDPENLLQTHLRSIEMSRFSFFFWCWACFRDLESKHLRVKNVFTCSQYCFYDMKLNGFIKKKKKVKKLNDLWDKESK